MSRTGSAQHRQLQWWQELGMNLSIGNCFLAAINQPRLAWCSYVTETRSMPASDLPTLLGKLLSLRVVLLHP